MQDDLIARIQRCPNLPSLPTIAMQVLDLAAKEDVDIAEIARLISRDPALSSKILRTVNSSFYGRSTSVATISTALVILGLQSVKTLVLGFSLVTNLSKDKKRGFNHMLYWRRSIYAAAAARTIAQKMKLVQQEEVFLAALLQDLGMLVLDHVLGAEYSTLCEPGLRHVDLVRIEQEKLGLTHAEVGELLTTQWKFPPLLSNTIGASHNPEKLADPVLRKLAQVIQVAGYCADVFVESTGAPAIALVRQQCQAYYKFSDTDCDQLLAEIAKKTKEVLSLFEINVGTAKSYDDILRQANETLVAMSLASQNAEMQLREQNLELQRQASTDKLTGLKNRATFDSFIVDRFAQATANNKPLTLLMMDIDHFKQVNDRFGHPSGDAVLKEVAKIIQRGARAQDLACRYGGEEMAVVLTDSTRSAGASIAETLRRAISAKPIAIGDGNSAIPVTISIGVATYEPGGLMKTHEHLIKAADMAVYAAKHSGRNCVKVFSVKPAAAA